ncbi:MAG: hypothetical protein KAS32_18830 [Candidatus Peribacteraceae bacterium]|nr:hypothetical protein [Candidatus Peribacteraceae bacterium]
MKERNDRCGSDPLVERWVEPPRLTRLTNKLSQLQQLNGTEALQLVLWDEIKEEIERQCDGESEN